jgi:hypothetical protein
MLLDTASLSAPISPSLIMAASARALRAVIALLEEREHSLAKRREHGARSLASKKVAAQFAF